MGAINVAGLWGAAKGLGMSGYGLAKGYGATGLGFAQRRGGAMMGRAIRNTEMLNAIGRSGGWKAAGSVLGGPARSGAIKGAMIGAGLNAGMSMISDARNGDFNSGSIGRGIGAGIRGGLLGGAIGGAAGVGNAMFRGNINRIASAQAKRAVAASAPMAAPVSRMSAFSNFMNKPRSFGGRTTINGRQMGGRGFRSRAAGTGVDANLMGGMSMPTMNAGSAGSSRSMNYPGLGLGRRATTNAGYAGSMPIIGTPHGMKSATMTF